MRITGTLHGIDTYEKTTDITADGVGGTAVTFTRGLLITADDDTLLYATVDIYPHPVNELIAGECTPENYAHALARLAHTADHFAREVRSSQALLERNTSLERTVVNMQGQINELVKQNDTLRQAASDATMEAQGRVDELETAKRTISELHAQVALTPASIADAERIIYLMTADNEERDRTIAALYAERNRLNDIIRGDTTKRDAAWAEYLDLRKQIRRLAAEGRTDSAEQGELVARACHLAGVHHFDSPSPEHEAALEGIAARDRTIAALTAKQAEQERLMTQYRVKYYEADQALRQAQADIEAMQANARVADDDASAGD